MESESILTAYLLPIILLALFVVLLIIIVIYCCMFKKDGKKGKNQLDYVTKGLRPEYNYLKNANCWF